MTACVCLTLLVFLVSVSPACSHQHTIAEFQKLCEEELGRVVQAARQPGGLGSNQGKRVELERRTAAYVVSLVSTSILDGVLVGRRRGARGTGASDSESRDLRGSIVSVIHTAYQHCSSEHDSVASPLAGTEDSLAALVLQRVACVQERTSESQDSQRPAPAPSAPTPPDTASRSDTHPVPAPASAPPPAWLR